MPARDAEKGDGMIRALFRKFRYVSLAIGLALPVCFVGGCRQEPPEPTQTKEERRMEEKEMLRRELRNE